jgi:hypothetical protein
MTVDTAFGTARGEVLPRCFLHVPKCGGTSIHAALETALPAGALAPRRMDTSILCGSRELEHVPASTRKIVVASREELHSIEGYRAISGHFSLPTLLEVTAAPWIGTVLREPRARLLSLYLYWRQPKVFDMWRPYSNDRYALQPLHRFVAEPRVAPAIDNQVCRMLLAGDPRIPSAGFISDTDVAGIATDAIGRLDSLGFVGVLELGEQAWRGLSRLFEVTLAPRRMNVAGEEAGPLPATPGHRLITSEGLGLIEQRSAADRVVYRHALALAGVCTEDQRQLEQSAFVSQLVQLGDLLGRSAGMLPDRDRAVERARIALDQRDQLYAQVRELRDHLDVTEDVVRNLESELRDRR